MLYLHEHSLSPDPTYGRRIAAASGNWQDVELYPHELMRATPNTPALAQWGKTLHLFHRPGTLALTPDTTNRAELLFDFGTEIDGVLCLELSGKSAANLMACFGESEPEAAGLIPGHHPNPTLYWHADKGRTTIEAPERGFRFVRLVFSDIAHGITLRRVSVRARLTFRERNGDFTCSDSRFQRVWQTSVYTARLCTKQDTIWDGIKRDRVGWYGDARIIKLAADNVFFDPRPAEAMLSAMPVDCWANNIPNYSFDGIAMLKQHILTYGADRPCVRPCYDNSVKLLDWAQRTQTNRDGLIIRTDHPYFGHIGFLDWSEFPSGGRFEELSWLQCKYLEAQRTLRETAIILGDTKTATRLTPRIDALARLISKRFWKSGIGFIHTRNHIGRPKPIKGVRGWNYDPFDTLLTGIHHHYTYVEPVRLGPSGPSRQCNALAVLAGLAVPKHAQTILRSVFDNPAIPPIVTAYFLYYEQMARGLCGDPAGAVFRFRDYVGTMLEREDAATIWEIYRPWITDLRKYFGDVGELWTWPYSLCHGWGAGAVPVAARFLLGIESVAPAFGTIALSPCTGIPWTFSATVPTPHGPITVTREKPEGIVAYRIPRAIQLTPQTAARIGTDLTITVER